jgi:hypothetical protein
LLRAQVQPRGKSQMKSKHHQMKSWQNFTRGICVFCLIGNESEKWNFKLDVIFLCNH